jgi:hypothetical protein
MIIIIIAINDKPGSSASTLAAENSYCTAATESIGSIMMKGLAFGKDNHTEKHGVITQPFSTFSIISTP